MISEHYFRNTMDSCGVSVPVINMKSMHEVLDNALEDINCQYMSNAHHACIDAKKDDQNNLRETSLTQQTDLRNTVGIHRNKTTEREILNEQHVDKTLSECNTCNTTSHLDKDKQVKIIQNVKNIEQTCSRSVTSLSSYLSSIPSSDSGSNCVSSFVSLDVYTPSESDILFQLLPTAPPNSDIESDFFSDDDDDFSSHLMNITSDSQFETREAPSAYVFNCVVEASLSVESAFEFSDVKRWLSEDVAHCSCFMKFQKFQSMSDVSKTHGNMLSFKKESMSCPDLKQLTLEDDLRTRSSNTIAGLNLNSRNSMEEDSCSLLELEASHKSVSMCSLISTEATCSFCCCCCRHCCSPPCCQ